MRKKIIEDQWKEYRKLLSPHAGKVQIHETRNAFYAGAYSLFTAMIKNVSQGTEDTPEDEKLMQDISDEFDDFRKELPPIPKDHTH